ncbi:hypothetical protein ACFL6B_00735 [Thermodesulfobacteriota bacterium]
MKDDTKKCRAEEKKCLSCGAGQDGLHLLNPEGEFRGGVLNYSFRCGKCKQYFKEYWINGKLKMTGAA